MPQTAERAMKIVPTTGNAALLMLQRTAIREEAGLPHVTPRSLAPQDPTKDPLAAGPGADRKARAAATAALFSVNRVTGETLLMQRAEQLGNVLGVERSKYKTFAEFSVAIREAMITLTARPDDGAMINRFAERMKLDPETVSILRQQKTPDLLFHLIEKHLELDTLGISLTGLVAAAQDLQGSDADRIIEMLERDRGLSGKDKSGETPVLVTTDEAGLYRVAAAEA
jgi:hypothetical protein